MFRSLLGAVALMMAGVGVVSGQVIIVDDNFDSYSTDAEFLAVWPARIGLGDMPAGAQDAGIISTDDSLFPGIQGTAIDHIAGAINQYEPASGGPSPGNPVVPTATQHVFLSADIFHDGVGNKRITVGLRNRQDEFDPANENIVELGFYNSNSCDVFVEGCGADDSPQNSNESTPGFYEGTSYATRSELFAGFEQPPLFRVPGWQYFQLPEELELDTDADELVNPIDIGAGWHQYTATIGTDFVTYEIDLFRDGVRNDTRDQDGNIVVGEGTPGVDASMTFPTSVTANGFDSLRIGGPSGLSSAGGGVAFDNILLMLIDAAPAGLPGDFNGDNVVDAADYTVFQDNFGSLTPLPNDDGLGTPIGQAHYDLWSANFGNTAAGSGLSASASIPEPTTLLLLVVGLAGQLLVSRRRRERC